MPAIGYNRIMENEGYFIDLTDEEGNNFKLEVVDAVEYNGDL